MSENAFFVRAARLFTGDGVLENAVLRVSGNLIAAVETDAGSARPEDPVFPVVTPALIDPHSHIGIHRAGDPAAESESNERMDSLVTLADALDSVQMDDPAFSEAVAAGVLYACVLPGSGNLVGGRSAVVRTFASDTSQALIGRAGYKAALGFNPISVLDWKGTRPNTRMGAFALLRSRFEAVRRQIAREGAASLSAEDAVIAELLDGREILRVHIHKIDDIAALLRLVDAYGLRITVEHAEDVHRPEIFHELARRDIPVVYGPIDSFAYKTELRHESWRNVAHLLASGARIGLMSDHPVIPCRQLLLQTRWFLRHGVSPADAMALVTRRNAARIGLEDRLGVLAPGKWASFVCWNGDPFHLGSWPVAVYGEGRRLYAEPLENSTGEPMLFS
ncbi:MAG: amidohydrolase family protein [Desulfococcaceae bacterium]